MITKFYMFNEGLRDKMTPKSKEEIENNIKPLARKIANELVRLENNGIGIPANKDYDIAYDFVISKMDMVKKLIDVYGCVEPYKIAINIQYDERLFGFDKTNEGIRDKMTPISDEKIKELRSKGKFSGEITVDGYSEKQAKSIIKSYSRKLNNVFKDDTENRVVDWVYQWIIPDSEDSDFSNIHLTLSCNNEKYTIDFVDGRKQSWRNIKNAFSGRVMGWDFQFTKRFYLLEDALGWLESCNIDISKITRT